MKKLLLRLELGDDSVDFLFPVGVTVDRLDEFSLLVVGDDAVAFEFGFLDFLGAFSGADEDVLEHDFFSFCLFKIIHDDRYFCTQRSSVEIVVGERGQLGFGGLLGDGSLGLHRGKRLDHKDGSESRRHPEYGFSHRGEG